MSMLFQKWATANKRINSDRKKLRLASFLRPVMLIIRQIKYKNKIKHKSHIYYSS